MIDDHSVSLSEPMDNGFCRAWKVWVDFLYSKTHLDFAEAALQTMAVDGLRPPSDVC
jgi:hypothetical protein